MNQAFPGATSNEILHADDSARLASLLDVSGEVLDTVIPAQRTDLRRNRLTYKPQFETSLSL